MPFISTKTNVKIEKSAEASLARGFGEAITLIGKSESWLMLEFEGDKKMYFKGSDSPCAIAEVSLFGKAGSGAYEKLTAELTRLICSELDVPADRVYVRYDEVGTWGWNGGNF